MFIKSCNMPFEKEMDEKLWCIAIEEYLRGLCLEVVVMVMAETLNNVVRLNLINNLPLIHLY